MIWRTALSWLVSPPLCVACRSWLTDYVVLCEECEKLIGKPFSRFLQVDNQLIRVYCASSYNAIIAHLVKAKHYGGIAAARQLGQLICLRTEILQHQYDCIIPVPLHWSRLWWRGFNQALVMAEEIGRHYHIPIVEGVHRIKYTALQTSLERSARRLNMEDAFFIAPALYAYRGCHILLVDDVMTTGSTLIAIVRELQKIKPASITIAVAAHGDA